ncbi:MAG: HAD-IIIA family hydrolase [Desulfobacterales bacterium]|nr:MAG: HAD-IIIA family hydrolase [Desulfobacterales bacterium]
MKGKAPRKLKNIQLLLFDVDGVLTDGRIIYDDGGRQTKEFNVRDGFGIKLVMAAGIKVGIVTGRKSEALQHRCRDLGIQYLYDGVQQKGQLLERIIEQTGVDADHTAFVGDDLPDICLMRRIGLPIAVADAHEIVKNYADWITSAAGGRGAVREVCEALLKVRGDWEKIIAEAECVG